MSDKIEKNYNIIMESFIKLLDSKSYDRISIQEIAKLSSMTRVNFYNYFIDKDDLLWKTFKYLYLEVEEKVEKLDPITHLSEGKPLTFYYFEWIKKYRYFFRSLFVNGMPYSFQAKFLDYIRDESFRTHEQLRSRYAGKIPYIRINQYLTGALFNFTRELLTEEEDWDSLALSQFFTNLALPGILSQLNPNKNV
ncbi:TetR/AcrR family transcriptional regulator [Leptospira sp. GIMC2001]|uniref:TetR/AcrR family transcriptional regulator n=1 Tax=Leptospira sp. GIMC2001 TaxID=1513297 RepID=UPI0023493818|nr:TetR/AcrR family transcriptional regulator [Leptospira sp. GIMC2001]WCL50158.1 TetR/AcrR family transcriptional regulator [Leptospira sp. GIMC2001]